MLKALVRHPRQPLSREKLAQLAAGREFEPFDRSLDVQVSRLRKLIEADAAVPRATCRPCGAWATCLCPTATPDDRRIARALFRDRARRAGNGPAPLEPKPAREHQPVLAHLLPAVHAAAGLHRGLAPDLPRAGSSSPGPCKSAQQLASLVNLSRAALVHSDPIARVSLVKTLVDEENVRIAPREPSDSSSSTTRTPLSRTRQRAAGVPGWAATPWWRARSTERRACGSASTSTATLLAAGRPFPGRTGGGHHLADLAGHGGWAVAAGRGADRAADQPPAQAPVVAASRVRDGDFKGQPAQRAVATSEIREGQHRLQPHGRSWVQDRAGPCPDAGRHFARPAHAAGAPAAGNRDERGRPRPGSTWSADIEQVNAIIDKFLDYARPDHAQDPARQPGEVVDAGRVPWGTLPEVSVRWSIPPTPGAGRRGGTAARVLQPAGKRPALRPQPDHRRGRDRHRRQGQDAWVLVKLRDHGPGVTPTCCPS
jgi:two-component system, OmpR family, osmolarity sensor histidine kinase EnvZ